MAVVDLLNHLSLNPKREGSQLKVNCPNCNDDKAHLYIHPDNGVGYCHKCGYSPNAYKLVEKLTTLDSPGIFKLLDEFNLNNGERPLSRNTALKKPFLRREDIYPLDGDELSAFCKVKGIDESAFLKLFPTPWRHRTEPWALLPAFEPGNLKKACGWMRVGLDGALVKTKHGAEKYPMVAGSQHGLFGARQIMDEKPDVLILTEAWRDAVAATGQGFHAIASSGGASTWRDEWLPLFKGRKVHIPMDADRAGVKAAERAARAIYGTAKEVRIVTLPYELQEKHGKDLYDYMSDHTKDDLLALIGNTPVYEPEQKDDDDQVNDGLPNLNASKGMIILPDLRANTIANEIHKRSNKDLHSHVRDGWSEYKGNKYRKIMPETTAQFINDYAIRCARKNADGITLFNPTDSKLRDITTQLSYMPEIWICPETYNAPCILNDGKLVGRKLVAFNNCLLDIDTYETFEPTKNFYNFIYSDFDYNDDAVNQQFLDFLMEIMEGDTARVTTLLEFFGYALDPNDHRHQCFLLCSGDGGNGKGTLFGTTSQVYGQCTISAVNLDDLKGKENLYGTYGKLLNITGESSDTVGRKAENNLKAYTGGDVLQFRSLYHNSFTAHPTAKMIIMCNDLIRWHDKTGAIWRRMLHIPFNFEVSVKDRNENLKAELLQNKAGIMRAILDGRRHLYENGKFTLSKISLQAQEEYRKEIDPSRQFLLDNYEFVDDNDIYQVKNKMYDQYKNWCVDGNYKPLNAVNFGKQVKRTFPQIPKPEQGEFRKEGGKTVYLCLQVKSDTEIAVKDSVYRESY